MCDECDDIVRFSKKSTGDRYRAHCEFAGDYEDDSWEALDYDLREEAWDLGLINGRWICIAVCRSMPTGVCKDRRKRTANGNIKSGRGCKKR